MREGSVYDAYWLVNGSLDSAMTFEDQVWPNPAGRGLKWCREDGEGVPEGLHEAILVVDGARSPGGDGWAWVGSARRLVTLDLENLVGVPVCHLYLAPSGAQRWGRNWMVTGERIEPGDFGTVVVPNGAYAALLTDCADRAIGYVDQLDLLDDGTTYRFDEAFSRGP